MGAAVALGSSLPCPLPGLKSLASSSAATRPSFSVAVRRSPILMSSGKVRYTLTSCHCGYSFRRKRHPAKGFRSRKKQGVAVVAAEAHRAVSSRFLRLQRISKNLGGVWFPLKAAEGDDVTPESSLERLFLSSDEAVEKEDEAVGTDSEFLEEGQRAVYLDSWQMKKMVAASNLGAHCVNVEALAVEVGLHSSDVLAWLEDSPLKSIVLATREGSYMEDVHVDEEVEKPAVYVPAPPILSRDVNMRNKVEDLMYTLKDIISGSLADIVADENKWDTTVKLFCETVELQNPLFCFRGRDVLIEWVQLLGRMGVLIKLHDIYYENTVNNPYNRWVYATWTATLTNDLLKSVLQLGLTDWWDSLHHDTELSEEKNPSTNSRVLLLSGEWRFEMDESGQVTNLHTRWYNLVDQGGGEDLIDAKLWLSGVLRRVRSPDSNMSVTEQELTFLASGRKGLKALKFGTTNLAQLKQEEA